MTLEERTHVYTEEDKKDLIKSIPFHIERLVDVEIGNSKGSPLFDDSILSSEVIPEIVDILLGKAPLYSSNNYSLDIIRDPLNNVPSFLKENEFWQTFFKYTLGSLYNELILYTFNRLKYPFVNEISLLYDSMFYLYENEESGILFENTSENEEISNLKLISTSNLLNYNNPQIEILDYWVSHSLASGYFPDSQKENEIILYKTQDLKNELLRRKLSGSLIGYQALLNSINVLGSLYITVAIPAEGTNKDVRVTRSINLPGITTVIPDFSITPEDIFPEVPSKVLIPAYYSSGDYNQDEFLSNPADFLRYKGLQVYWDNLKGIVDTSLVKKAYLRMDQPNQTFDSGLYLDSETPFLQLTGSKTSFLDLQCNRVYNIKNSLQKNLGRSYPYYIDTVAERSGPVLMDTPWLYYIEEFIEDRKRVTEQTDIGVQISYILDAPAQYIKYRELGFAYKEELLSEEEYVYDSSRHNYMFIYSVEIQYHRENFTVRQTYPRKKLVTIIYIRQSPFVDDENYLNNRTYLKSINNSIGILPFKYQEINPSSLINYKILLDESAEDKVVDLVSDSGYALAYFYFYKNEQSLLNYKNLVRTDMYMRSFAESNSFVSRRPFNLNAYFLQYGYERELVSGETKSVFLSDVLNIYRLDYLMELTQFKPYWYENVFFINPHLNFLIPNCSPIVSEGSYLEPLNSIHNYDVYLNNDDEDTATRLANNLPIGFYLKRTRPESVTLATETFQIWGDYREPVSDILDDTNENVYRNNPLVDIYSVYHLKLGKGSAFDSANEIDSYFDLIPSTVINDTTVHPPLWYWNRQEAYNGFTFTDKFLPEIDDTYDQYILNRYIGSGTTSDAGDELEIYYDSTLSEYVMKIYPTGYSIDNIASNNLGSVYFELRHPYTHIAGEIERRLFSYKLEDDSSSAEIKHAYLTIIINGNISTQEYIITRISYIEGTSATYDIYDVNNATTISNVVLDFSLFNYDARKTQQWQHFLGMLHKDAGQSNYSAEPELNLYHQNRKNPSIGNIYDFKLFTTGFESKEAFVLFSNGSRVEYLSHNIDAHKVHHHFSEDFTLTKKVVDSSIQLIERIRVFDRTKWKSIIVDPCSFSTEEKIVDHDRYRADFADPLDDTDVYVWEDPLYDDAEGTIKSYLNNNIEIIRGLLWDSAYDLIYKGEKVDSAGRTYDLIQTSLYPVVYNNQPIITGVTLKKDGNSFKAYRVGSSDYPTEAVAIEIETNPVGDSLVYKFNINTSFQTDNRSYLSRAFYKGPSLEPVYNSHFQDVAIRTIQTQINLENNVGRLLTLPLNIPPQVSTLDTNLRGFYIEGLIPNGTLKNLLNPNSYYQEILYPYLTGYRVDVVRTLKEGVYFIPIKIPVLVEAEYRESQRRVVKNIGALLRITVEGTIVDNSSEITEDTLRTFYSLKGDTISLQGYPLTNGEGLYRRIDISVDNYRYISGSWSWNSLTVSDGVINDPVAFYFSDDIDENEYFQWDDTSKTFEDLSTSEFSEIPIKDATSYSTTSSIPFLREDHSYIMHLNLRSVTSVVRFSSDITCEPTSVEKFEEYLYEDVTESINSVYSKLLLRNENINHGYSISGGVFETTNLTTGILGDPYSKNQSNYLLTDIYDSGMLNANLFFMRFYDFNSYIGQYPIAFKYLPDSSIGITSLFSSTGAPYNVRTNEKSLIKGYYNNYKLNVNSETIRGFYSIKPLIINSTYSEASSISISAQSDLYPYRLSNFSKNILKWRPLKKTVTKFIKGSEYDYYSYLNNKIIFSYYNNEYCQELIFTGTETQNIYFTKRGTTTYSNAYVTLESNTAVSVNGVAVTADTRTTLFTTVINGEKISITPSAATTIRIYKVVPFNVETSAADHMRFLTKKDATGKILTNIVSNKTFVYITDDSSLKKKWFIQFKSSYTSETLSTQLNSTEFNTHLNEFLQNNLNQKTGKLLNPWKYTFFYKEKDSKISAYIGKREVPNVISNLIYIKDMQYMAALNTINIGSSEENSGILLNADVISKTNLELGNTVEIFNESFSAISNCINVEDILKKKPSINAVTNFQLLTDSEIVYEFETPPIIYDELTQHISFNLLLER